MATIDSLEIQISAQANKANASVELLSKKLDRLSSSLSSVNSRGLATLGVGVNKLANAMSNFSANTKTADFSRLARSLTTISNIDNSKFSELSAKISQLSTAFGSVGTIDASGITNIGTSLSKLGGKNAIAGADNLIKVGDKLSKFVTQMNSIGSLTFDVTNLSNLISSISRLGGKASTSAVTSIPKLSAELSSLMTTLSRAPAINKNVIDMTNALANLARTGASSGKAANLLSQSFANISSTGNKTLGTLRGIQSGFRSLLRSILSFVGAFQLFSFGKQAIETSSSLTEVQNVVSVTFSDMAYKVEELAKTSIEQFGLSELSLKEFSSRFQAMGTAMGFPIEKMSDMSIELTKLTADMASFYNVTQEDVARSLQSVFTGETEPLRKYGIDLTQATLQEWAMKNGLDANIQSMSQAEKTMLRYQYVLANTKAAQGDFARTVDTWANQVRILKQNFEQLAAVIGGVLVNAFKPVVKAVNAAMSAIITFAKTISNALGKIFGWTYEEGGGLAQDFEEAAAGANDISDGMGGAAKNAKELKTHLLSIDELNVVEPEEVSGGGAGGAGTGGALSGTEAGGEWVQGESILKGFESQLDTLYKLGDYIGTKLSEAMESIRWEDVYEKARNFGTGLASFLNGLISLRLFGNVGTTIAGSLNTALHFLDSFGEEFDWKNFGNSIATGINHFFDSFDFGLLASTLNTWANGLLDALIEFLDKTEWKKIGEQIGTFLAKIDFIDIGKKIGIAIWEAINTGIDLLKGMFNVAPIETVFLSIGVGAVVVAKLMSAFAGLGEAITGIGALFAPITSLFAEGGIFGAGGAIATASMPILALAASLLTLVAGLGYVFVTNEEVRKSFLEALSAIKDGLQPSIEFFANTLLPDLQSGWNKLIEVLTPLGDFLENTFTSIWQDMLNPALTYIGEAVLPVLASTFENLWNNVLVPLGTYVAEVFSPVVQILSDLLSFLWQYVVIPLAEAIGGIFSTAFEGISAILNNTVIPAINLVIEAFRFVWKQVFEPIVSFMQETMLPVYEGVFAAIGELISALQQEFQGLIDFITGVFSGDWEKAWEGIKEVFRGIFNGIGKVFESIVNGIVDGMNKFLSGFNDIVTTVGDIVGIDIHIPTIPHIKIQAFAMGGFPEDGLFMANHTELVGKFTNGKTAVANNEQIIKGIKEGVSEAVASVLLPYLQDIAENTRETASKEMSVNIGDRDIVESYDRGRRRMGWNFQAT